MKITYTITYPDKTFEKFTRKWNGFTRTLAAYQKQRLNTLEGEIKHRLATDERPNNRRYPWTGHVYTGELLNSVSSGATTTSDATHSYMQSYVGYEADHGTNIEPPAVVTGNKFESVPMKSRSEDLGDLYNWAYDLVTRRTTGTKLSGAAAASTAKKWARNLQAYFMKSKNYKGYPIIVEEFEKMFGDGKYLDAICRKIKYGVIQPRG